MNNVVDLTEYKKNRGLENSNPVLNTNVDNQRNQLKKLQREYNATMKFLQSFSWIQSFVSLISNNPETWAKITEARKEVDNLLSEINNLTKQVNARTKQIIWPETGEMKKAA